MEDCVFCNIANKSQASEIYFEDEDVMVIQDIMPKAPVHFLVIPKVHLASINSLIPGQHDSLITKMIYTAKAQAESRGVSETGYKLVFNVGKEGGQVIPHLHLHVLGGKQMEA